MSGCNIKMIQIKFIHFLLMPSKHSFCNVIHYGNSIPQNQCTLKELDGVTMILSEDQNECDSGITFDSKLSFQEHIA